MIREDEDIHSMSAKELASRLNRKLRLLETDIEALRDDLADYREQTYYAERMAQALQEKLEEQETK